MFRNGMSEDVGANPYGQTPICAIQLGRTLCHPADGEAPPTKRRRPSEEKEDVWRNCCFSSARLYRMKGSIEERRVG